MAKKLVLAVIDAMKPAMLERAIATGRAPTLERLIQEGQYTDECVAAFPSVTPVCAASIATGTGPAEHEIPAMNWWHRGEERYVEYGTSFGASRAFGIRQSLTDTIYNMNLEHLSREVKTVFETLDDQEIRTAGTTYLMYRGRHRHEPSVGTALSRLAHTVFGMPTWGPKELFYADLFASRKTSCRSQLGLPGVRDQHSGCVAEYLVENDLFDFLLLSLPDNDTHSHKYGPFAQVDSIAAADRQIARMMEPAGGPEKFLEDHALIVCSDHSQSKVEGEIDLFKAFDGFGLRAAQRAREDDEIAVCPNSRAAQVYVLDRSKRRTLIPRVERTLLALEGVDLVMRMGDHPDGEAIVRGERSRGVNQVRSETYPDAMSRVWSALRCPSAGDVLASARPGYEFVDWGGAHHIGGGSHGSLHANDSNATLLWTGTGPEKTVREQWALRDITPMVLEH